MEELRLSWLAEDRIPNERLSLNQRLTFLIKAITETPRGKEIFLSRAAPEFVEKLFAREVPEISSKSVEIKAIAREAGVRTKIAVASDSAQELTRLEVVLDKRASEFRLLQMKLAESELT